MSKVRNTHKAKAYLIGAMENVSGGGRKWRRRWGRELEKLDIEVIDPTNLNSRTPEGDKIIRGKTALQRAKDRGNLKRVIRLMDGVWTSDERNVEESDFIIFYEWRKKIRSIGSVREKQKAFDAGKVVLTVYPHDWRNLSFHALHLLLKKGRIFSSFRGLLDFLKTQKDLKKIKV